MFLLTSSITIGAFKNVKVNACTVKKSIHSFVDKATIKIPISARVKQGGAVKTATTETAKLITEGMPVKIDLGYDGKLNTEFEGFVARVNFSTPCEIECEGYSYLLRKKRYSKLFKNTTLKLVLEFICAGTGITLSKSIPDVKIVKLAVKDHTGTEVLEMITKELQSSIGIFFIGKELYAGLVYLLQDPVVNKVTKYRLGWNTVKDDQLKLREAKNQEVIIRMKGKKADGTKVTASYGEKGEVKEISTHAVQDQATLNKISESIQKKQSYSGYEGKITGFLHPFTTTGQAAQIIDKNYPEREGKYMVEATEVNYNLRGARRVVSIGFKLRD